jgi:hypothetical protein
MPGSSSIPVSSPAGLVMISLALMPITGMITPVLTPRIGRLMIKTSGLGSATEQ